MPTTIANTKAKPKRLGRKASRWVRYTGKLTSMSVAPQSRLSSLTLLQLVKNPADSTGYRKAGSYKDELWIAVASTSVPGQEPARAQPQGAFP